ncbi:MAG: sulfur carrier protein ThiS [Clostridia bacterium]|nr:sulfur carrier protein ThiS [Clostridia bacterium]
MVKINGEDLNVGGKSVAEYLNSAGYDLMRVAVELNGGIVPKAQYEDTIFKNGDSVEIVSFVGGG